MQRSLHEHILFLEEQLQALYDQLTDPSQTRTGRERIEAEINLAKLALTHYRTAFDLEQRLIRSSAS